MAQRGSKKALATAHENWIAGQYNGKRSISSGGAWHDAGDVRTEHELIECKAEMPTEKNAKKKTKILAQMEKAADEAWQEGRTPALALRYYQPDSILANPQGYVDLIVRMTQDDARR